jgi:predicted nucleotidyltransferase component of viral defense system
MKYATAAAFRTALDQRLKNEAARTGLALARLRKRVAFELFLRRLVTVAPERWVLKGAFALDLRLQVPTRTTKDIDLGRADDEEAAIEDVTAAQQVILDDFFSFVATKTDALDEADDFTAIRFHVRAELATRTFEQFALDIGFTDPITWTPDTVQTSGLLTFAGIQPISVPTVRIPQHLAEKVHAYTRSYGPDAERSSRPKDLVDILLISTSEEVDAAALREALERTFSARRRQQLPEQLPLAPPAWDGPYRRLAADVDVEAELDAAAAQAQRFLDPVLDGTAAERWDPMARRWR